MYLVVGNMSTRTLDKLADEILRRLPMRFGWSSAGQRETIGVRELKVWDNLTQNDMRLVFRSQSGIPYELIAEVEDSRPRIFNVMQFGAQGDGVTDDTAALNAASETCSAAGGGIVLLPARTYFASGVYIHNGVMFQGTWGIRGEGTRILAARDEPIVSFYPGSHVVRAGIRNIGITAGDAARAASMPNTDGLTLAPDDNPSGNGYWHDTIIIDQVSIGRCGGRGLVMSGRNSQSGFVQKLLVSLVTISDCYGRGLDIQGQVIEGTFIGLGVTRNCWGDDSLESVYIANQSGYATRVPKRLTFINAVWNNTNNLTGYLVKIAGGENLCFICADFEEYPNCFLLDHTVGGQLETVAFHQCSFGGVGSQIADKSNNSLVDVGRANGLLLDNCSVANGANPIGVRYTRSAKTASKIQLRNIHWGDIEYTVKGPGVVGFPGLHPESETADPTTVNIRQYEGVVVLDHTNTGDLNLGYIYDEDGGTNLFVDGMVISLAIENVNRTFTIVTSGNISLSGSYSLDSLAKRQAIQWCARSEKWVAL